MEDKALLGLCMIVKNEEHVIERAMRSALRMMDTFCIVDTGSTDKTKEIIQKVSDELGIKGFVYDRPWVNFGVNRTEALDLARAYMKWGFMLDADDIIQGEPIDKSLLKDDITGYNINLYEGSIINRRTSLTNLKYDWKYKGALHEYPMNSSNKEIYNYDKKTYILSKREGSRSNDQQKYLKDSLILQKELDTNPDCDKKRTLFYLAQSYRDAGIKDLAIKYYLKRTEVDGWVQEKYVSYLNLIRLNDNLEEKLSYAWKAQNIVSTRNECVYEILSYVHKNNKFLQEIYALGLAFKNNKLNVDSLFVEPKSYNWSYYDLFGLQAYYTKHFEESYEAFKKAYAMCPDDQKERIKNGIYFCKDKIKNFDFEYKNIEEIDISELDINSLNIDDTNQSRINNIKDNLEHLINNFEKNNDETNIKNLNYLLEQKYQMKEYNNLYNNYINKFDKILTNKKDVVFKNKTNPKIILTITTCKRFNLFEKTINSILNTWKDIELIDYFFCVDDNSSDEDRLKMKENYPFFDFYFKSEEEKGHRKSMNIIYDKLNELNPTYWIQLEDDWQFFYMDNYVSKSIDFLEKYKEKNIHQILFNRNYGYDITSLKWNGGEKLDDNYLLHIKSDNIPGENCAYWPHFSFRPSMILVDTIKKLGNFDSSNNFFERDYADKYFDNGYKSAFFDRISSKDIGKGDNAYKLNNLNQFNTN